MRPLLEAHLDAAGLSVRSDARECFSVWLPFWKRLVESFWEAGILTLEDQKYWGLELLATKPAAFRWLEKKGLTHVLVDEFQDINYLDLAFINQITESIAAKLVIVGDDDQCIYEWRGCTSQFIRKPENYYQTEGRVGEFHTILLRKNYRCPKNIVKHSQSP